jgi:hypothetical protein
MGRYDGLLHLRCAIVAGTGNGKGNSKYEYLFKKKIELKLKLISLEHSAVLTND